MVFNFPLVIVDIYGLSILSWGNQCYMTMVESLVLSFVSLALLLWETKNRMYLISREMSTLSLEKLEQIAAGGNEAQEKAMKKMMTRQMSKDVDEYSPMKTGSG